MVDLLPYPALHSKCFHLSRSQRNPRAKTYSKKTPNFPINFPNSHISLQLRLRSSRHDRFFSNHNLVAMNMDPGNLIQIMERMVKAARSSGSIQSISQGHVIFSKSGRNGESWKYDHLLQRILRSFSTKLNKLQVYVKVKPQKCRAYFKRFQVKRVGRARNINPRRKTTESLHSSAHEEEMYYAEECEDDPRGGDSSFLTVEYALRNNGERGGDRRGSPRRGYGRRDVSPYCRSRSPVHCRSRPSPDYGCGLSRDLYYDAILWSGYHS